MFYYTFFWFLSQCFLKIFGFQASIFSRIIYIVIGASSVFLVYKLFKGKGSIPVFTRNNKKDLAQNIEKMRAPKHEKAYANIEASKEIDDNEYYDKNDDFDQDFSRQNHHKSLFDEHLDES